jgi:hypothetical protein
MTFESFPGNGRDEDDEAFLAELRACAEARGLVDATPKDTLLLVWESALVALVEVSRLQDIPAKPTLEVVSDIRRSPELWSGWETYGYLTDADEKMDLTEVELTPRALARHAFGWFQAQLRRPVEQHGWTSGPWPPRVEVRLREPDELLDVRRSGWPFRRRRSSPDRLVRLR